MFEEEEEFFMDESGDITQEKIGYNMKDSVSKAKVDVINVGQGDCILIRPEGGCMFDEKGIFIDLGPGDVDITYGMPQNKKFHIFLTHHDKDHMGGLKFFLNRMEQVESIIIPFYQREITLIAKAILNLKGIRESKQCDDLIQRLEEIVNNYEYLIRMTETGTPKIQYVYEDKIICKHIECLNPPRIISSNNWLHESNVEEIFAYLYGVFNIQFANELLGYYNRYAPIRNNLYYKENREKESTIFNNYIDSDESPEIQLAKDNYVLDFLIMNLDSFVKFNRKPNRKNFMNIYKKYDKSTHDVCTVLRTNYNDKTFLLTADASKKVFKRLIREGKNITADYLKVPHHGSKHNMNAEILKHINPEVAIISHGNRVFGKSRDSHPNMEILNLLQSNNIRILITNDVKKGKGKRILYLDKKFHRNDPNGNVKISEHVKW